MKKILWTLPLALALTACSATGADSNADEINIVTSTQVWADVAQEVTDLEVQPIIIGGDSDPHSFEPSAADMARVESADIIIVGGGGYDSWLYDALEEDDDRIVHALELSEHNHEEEDHAHVDNEHVWYSTEAVAGVAEDLAEKIHELDPAATVTPETITSKMDELHDAIHELPAARVAQTEPIADHILSHSDIIESTPEGYRSTTLSEGEPTAADVAAFQNLINENGIDVLIYNPQSASPVATSLKDLAQEKGITIVEISETPNVGENFLDTFTTAVSDLATATQGA